MTTIDSSKLLVVVHPGSLCNSYRFNGGTDEDLVKLLDEVMIWTGTIITLDNDLTDEIEGNLRVKKAYDRSQRHYPAAGWDDELKQAAEQIATDYIDFSEIVVTGAWVGEHGCCTCIAEYLRMALGDKVTISKNAAREAETPQTLTLPMRLIVTGGRDYRLSNEDVEFLDTLHAQHTISELVSGGARGVDKDAENWAISKGIRVNKVYPDWKRDPGCAVQSSNKRMSEYASAVAAFPGSNGTQHMIDTALQKGLTVYVSPSRAVNDRVYIVSSSHGKTRKL